MTEILVNNNGTGKIVCKQDNILAFILNRASAKNPNGDNITQQLPTKEFYIKNIEQEVKENKVLLSWETFIEEQYDIHFVIEKINSNGIYAMIENIQVITSNVLIPYHVTLPYEKTHYQIKVVKNNKERISKKITEKNTKDAFIYPTLCKDKLYVNIANKESNYSIIDQNGKLIQQGALLHSLNILQVHTLTQGVYFIILSDNIH